MDIRQISEKFQLNDTESSVLQFMYSRTKNLKEMSIRDVANATYTSPGYIVKIAHKLKLSGYKELVYLMTNTLKYPDVVFNEVEPYQDVFTNLIRNHQNDEIMILASGYSQNVADYMADYFNMHNFRVTSKSHLEFLRDKYHNENCLIIAVSNSGETSRLEQLIRDAVDNGHDVISFVGNAESTIAQCSTLSISTNSFFPAAYDEEFPPLFFGKALIYFELLMNKAIKNNNIS